MIIDRDIKDYQHIINLPRPELYNIHTKELRNLCGIDTYIEYRMPPKSYKGCVMKRYTSRMYRKVNIHKGKGKLK